MADTGMAPTNKAPTTADDDVIEFEPDFSLKEKIGKDIKMRDILSDSVIKDGQKVIDQTRSDFIKWVENDLKTFENAYMELAAHPQKGREFAFAIQQAAFSIKSQSGTFGYDLGSAIAKSLYDFLENDYVEGEKGHLIVIRKHIDTLNSIFHHKVQGDGGKLGNEVLQALGQLIRKFEVN